MKDSTPNNNEDYKEFNFGHWLKQLRKERNLTRQIVADRSKGGISQQYIHFIETGKATNIGSNKLHAIAKGMNIPVEILETALFRKVAPTIPIIGRAAAGAAANSLSEEYQSDSFPYISTENNLISLEIMGDSMAPKIAHGDLALAIKQQKNEPLVSGSVYLIKTGNKITCKYILESQETPNTYILRAENQHLFPDTVLNKAKHKLLGRVIEVRKSISLMCNSLH